jgi:hypothetical protein
MPTALVLQQPPVNASNFPEGKHRIYNPTYLGYKAR